ncbi:MAG: right-handed parallel beta-helix repeat-containing protein, partial [Lachnospiraceae bacterium]|nr:right-handed parallel beta-helix repeat-containing protein [Lachnospiraceae bacterium]
QILGEGAATIDLNNVACQGIAAAHCNRLTISGISFKNMNTYHFIELAGNANVNISGNYFYGYSASKTTRKEAINLDTPDAETHGFNQYWTSLDKTANKNVVISDNVFFNVECGIGTHKYSEGHPHKNISILKNTFIDSATYSIRCMNWENPTIRDNSFIYSAPSEIAEITVILNGVKDPIITGNRFENLETPISFYHWKNSGYGKDYAPIYNEVSELCMTLLKTNYLVNVTNPYFEYYRELDDYSEDNLELHPIGIIE